MTDQYNVSRPEFQDKLNILYYNKRPESNTSFSDEKQEYSVIQFLQEVEECIMEKNLTHHHCAKAYELTKIGNEARIILKRRYVSEPLVFMVAVEDL